MFQWFYPRALNLDYPCLCMLDCIRTKTLLTLCDFSHPLPILNISEHLTRLKLQQNNPDPFGARRPPFLFFPTLNR